MKKILLFLYATCTLLLAAPIKPVMIYDSEILDDKSWNAMIHKGIVRFEKRFTIDVEEVMILDNSTFNQKVKALANSGFDPIIVNNVDSIKQQAIKEVMLEYPKKRFIVLNGSFNIHNADFYVFSYEEVTFMAGYLAALKTKTNTLGFVGGMEIPLIKNFLCGYIQGAKLANPKINILYDFIGNDFNAWNNPKKGYALTIQQIEKGADIIFGPAGGSSLGVLKAAHDQGKLGIGTDSNQNYLYPGSVLTSAVVHVDKVAYIALTAANRGLWRNQIKRMGLQEKGLSLAFDQHNESLISQATKNKLNQIQSDITLKKIKIDNYNDTQACIIEGKKLF